MFPHPVPLCRMCAPSHHLTISLSCPLALSPSHHLAPPGSRLQAPFLRHREREIATVVSCLRDGLAYPLRGDTGLPFTDGPAAADVLTAGEGGGGGEGGWAAREHCAGLLRCIDPTNIAIVGHSFGAATAITVLQSKLPELHRAFNRAVLLDPWVE